MSEHHAASPIQHATVQETMHGSTRSHIILGYAVLGSHLAWALHLSIVYFLVGPVCYYGGVWTMHVVSVVLLVVTLGTVLASYHFWKQSRKDVMRDLEGRGGWLSFLSMFGMGSGLLFSLTIIATWVPIFFINPCA